MVADVTIFLSRNGEVILPPSEGDCVAGTYAGTRRRMTGRTAIGAQIAFDGVVILRVVAHGAIGTGDDALTAPGAPVLIHGHDAGHRVLGDGLRIDRTGAQAGRPLAVLAGNSQEIERRPVGIGEPDNPIAILTGAEPVLLLAGDLTTLAADAALEIDHQREPFRPIGGRIVRREGHRGSPSLRNPMP